MSTEALLTIAGLIIGFGTTIATVVYFAGRGMEKLENLDEKLGDLDDKFNKHEAKDADLFEKLFDRDRQHGEELSGLKASSGMHLERRAKSGGYPHPRGAN